MPDVDVAVIGAGAAGLSVAAISAGLGLKVALFERGAMGGDCLNTGCVPSKALLAAAHAAAEARRAHRFGIRLPPPGIDWGGVRAHVAGAVAAIAPNDSEERVRAMGVNVVRASARFAAPDIIDAGTHRFHFRRAVIAAGSAAIIPPIRGLAAVPFLTNETLFALKEPPGHLLVLGGGPIGLEMAQAHARLGCRVTVVEAATIAGREEPECLPPLREALAADGVSLHEGVRVEAAEPDEAGVALLLDDGTRLAGTHLLIAVGRAPSLAGLDLAAAGIAPQPPASPPTAPCAPSPTAASGPRATSRTRRGSGRAPSPMSARSMPRSSRDPCCSACPRGCPTPRCRASPTPTPASPRSARPRPNSARQAGRT